MPQFDHEKLKVYQAAIRFVAWSTELAAQISSKAAVKDQLDRASTSIPLNIAEGNGKFAIKDGTDQQSEHAYSRGRFGPVAVRARVRARERIEIH